MCKKCLLNIAGFCSKLCPDTIKDIEIKITEHKGEYIDTKVFLNMYRGIIIGHSFVKGFADHLAGQNGGVPMSDAGVAEALKVSDGVGAVRLFGVSGARVLGNFTLPNMTLNTLQPHFAILNIGGNDLTHPTSPHQQGMLAQAIVAMANDLINNYGVVEVHICQIIDRMEGLAGISCDEYRDAAYAVNKRIMGLCAAHPRMHFQVMKGFCRNSPESWTWDGIHPNKPRGRVLYKRVMKKAIFRSLKTLREGNY